MGKGIRRSFNQDPDDLSMRQRSNLACMKITSEFPDCPSGKLMAAVVAQAVMDLSLPDIRPDRKRGVRGGANPNVLTAQRYLAGCIDHAEVAGVASDWVRSVLRRMRLLDVEG